MAESTKHNLPINGGTLISDLKNIFSLKTKRTVAFAYGFMFAFVLFTIFLTLNPQSQTSSSPWFSNIFTNNSFNNSISNPFSSKPSNRSQYPSIFSFFFPNSTQNATVLPPITQNLTKSQPLISPAPVSQPSNSSEKHSIGVKNGTVSVDLKPKEKVKNGTVSVDLKPKEKVLSSNLTTSLQKKQSNDSRSSDVHVPLKKGNEQINLVDNLINCDLFDGNWVKDDSYPLYKPGSCSIIDEQFNCLKNGRPDQDYQKLKWKPHGCTLPRLEGGKMLELLRGKRLVFVGDSLNRNMWESLICILKNSAKDQKKVYEASGRKHFRGEAWYSFVFEEYNLTVELFVSPFLVHEWEIPEKDGKKKETLRLDLIGGSAENYKDADVIVFNTGHWWTHDKTAKGKDYYQEGSHVYGELNVLEAFRKALTTWARWVDAKVDPKKSLVFFRGYSASHFSGGQWNSGGQCDHETEPIKNQTYLTEYPPKMLVLEKVLKGMKTPVSYLNITRLTDYRKDGHPSMYRKLHFSDQEKNHPTLYQDCSHWCLPGVPDSWNEILYAELLVKQKQKNRS